MTMEPKRIHPPQASAPVHFLYFQVAAHCSPLPLGGEPRGDLVRADHC
jgi:hypothetical protein